MDPRIRTMSTVWHGRLGSRRPAAVHAPADASSRRPIHISRVRRSAWVIREPLVDLFVEDDSVMLVIDLGGFRRHEVSLNVEHRRLEAARAEHRWTVPIDLPPQLNVASLVERLVNGVLVMVMPRRHVLITERR